MPTSVKELKPEEFTERLLPVFRSIEAELGRAQANPNFFFPHWRNMMKYGVARTWEAEGALLGAIFFADTFTGEPKACVHFLFTVPEVRGTGTADSLLDSFEAAATGRKKSIAAHSEITTDKARHLYKRRGYEQSEEIWSKI